MMKKYKLFLMSGVSEEQANDIATAMVLKCGELSQVMPASSLLARGFAVLMPFIVNLARKDCDINTAIRILFDSAGTIGANENEGRFIVKMCVMTLKQGFGDNVIFRIKAENSRKPSSPVLSMVLRELGDYMVFCDY